jgi:hypothetical protein
MTGKPRKAMVKRDADQILNAPIISAPTQYVESEMVCVSFRVSQLVARWTVKGDRVWELAGMACEMDPDANGVVDRSSIAAAGTMEVNDVDPAIGLTGPKPSPSPRKAMLFDPLGEIGAGTVKSLPHHLCR